MAADLTARLNPQARALRDRRVSAGLQPLYTLSIPEARAADLAEIQADAARADSLPEIIDRTISGPAGEVPVRIYVPPRDGYAERFTPGLLDPAEDEGQTRTVRESGRSRSELQWTGMDARACCGRGLQNRLRVRY